MKSRNYLRASGPGCSITIYASPGASRTEITGVNQWRGALQVRIAAQPREGAANEELVKFLSERLAIPKTAVRVVKGERSSLKMVYVPLSLTKVKSILGGE